jgi:hypothetical protein
MWNADVCKIWFKRYADGIAEDAFKMGGDEVLYACAGAAYYAINAGVGYHTEDQFCQFVRRHMGLDEDFLEEALKVIKEPIR